MKRFIAAVAILVMASTVTLHAQTDNTTKKGATNGNLKSTEAHVATDTVANTTTKAQVGTLNGYASPLVFQTVLTKISGTPGGVVRLYGSLDNANWFRVNPTDSILVANVATQAKAFIVDKSNYIYYKMEWVPTGSHSTKMLTYWLQRKPYKNE